MNNASTALHRLSWTTAFKIAWREARASSAKFLFVILAVAIGVGSLTGVRGFSHAFQDLLLREARTLMAADLSLRVFALPTDAQTSVMQTLEKRGIERTWLITTGSRASERFLFRLNPGAPGIQEVRVTLQKAFPDSMIADFRQTHPVITQGLNRSSTFLSLVSLIALIIGALGVATAMRAHLEQRMDSIAIMKCIGARTREVIQIYLLQTLGLGLAGGLLGI